MANTYYVASCVFTAQFPELSLRIQEYVRKRYGLSVVRCCFPKYKIREFEEKMPAGRLREAWSELSDSAPFTAGDTTYSLCHNCSNIIEEMHPGVAVRSLWELINEDEMFPFPDYPELKVTVQDCWRAAERSQEQDAVRELLQKMHIDCIELDQNRNRTKFCGSSLYRAQPPRNPKAAPHHYVERAAGLFIPHSESEQIAKMREYCERFETRTVVCYCHYCLEGLIQGGKDGRHIAQLLFPKE